MANFSEDCMVIGGSSNPELVRLICDHLGISPANRRIGHFSDGETRVEIYDNMRRKEVYIIQSLAISFNEDNSKESPNDNLMSLLCLIDACRRASASAINVVIPYFGYARQDKKDRPRVPITVKLIMDMLASAGATRVITVDLHANQIQGFANIPVDNLFARPNFIKYIKNNFKQKDQEFNANNLVLVSPDAGGAKRVRVYSKHLPGSSIAIADKRRENPNEVEEINILGDVNGKTAIIIDDIIDTAKTVTMTVEKLLEKGATSVHALCTHPVLSGGGLEKIIKSPIKTLVISDTYPANKDVQACQKIKIVSVYDLLATAILKSFTGESISELFQ